MSDANDFLQHLKTLLDQHVAPADAPDDKPPLLWQLESMADAYQLQPPLYYVVDGLLPAPSLSIVYGGPGSLKSMLLADMAVCVAGGIPWLSQLPEKSGAALSFATTQSPVLWIDFDNGKRKTRERIGALGRGHGLAEDAPLHYVSMPLPWLNASDRTIVGELVKLIKHNKYRLVIIDNLGLVTGDVEENSGEMAMVMGHFRWLSEETDCAVVVVHHQRKSTNSTGDGARKGESLRGHSSIEASLDLALLVERSGQSDGIVITTTKVREYLDFEDFGALWTFEHVPETRQLWRGKFFARQVETSEEAANSVIKQMIRESLHGEKAMTQTNVVDAVRDALAALPGGKAPGINKVRGLLTQLVQDGIVLEIKVDKHKEYRLV